MKLNPRFNQSRHNPPESYGDCVSACLNTMLDRDDVPHTFGECDAEESFHQLRVWLRSIGFTLFITSYDGEMSKEEFFKEMGTNNPDVVYMLMAGTEVGDHAVVCYGDKIIHNPAWWGCQITKPHSLNVWIVAVLGKL